LSDVGADVEFILLDLSSQLLVDNQVESVVDRGGAGEAERRVRLGSKAAMRL
jgi:hypothetical protein